MKVKPEKTFIKGQEETPEGPIQIYGYSFRCPGCGHLHVLNTNPLYHNTCWGFNGNVDHPTFTPSLLCKSGWYVAPDIYPVDHKSSYLCHSFITNGQIQYLSDCTHHLAGQTIELSEIE